MARCRAPSESPLEKRWWRSLTPGIFLKSDIPNVIIELEAEMRAVAAIQLRDRLDAGDREMKIS
jgi:hypothetical protein